jgi:DHA2 family multidrug resistance protein
MVAAANPKPEVAESYPDPLTRLLITGSIMLAMMMAAIDTTIANVALPHIQASVSASRDQITWVLTSYIISSAVFTPLTGWLADRYGRKRVLMLSVFGFTAVSVLCGMSTSLEELVIFRALQGVSSAAIQPLNQAIMFDINPPERYGPAMATFGMGAMVGPILGPTVGGWITEHASWHWVFFINLPLGVLALIGMSAFLSESRHAKPVKLDLIGFAMLSIALCAFQLTLDRGQERDWFSSTEICIEATAAVLFLYLFTVHSFTTREAFIAPELFEDRNFLFGSVIGFVLGTVTFSVMALLPLMLEGLLGYSAVLTGISLAPRGIGTMISMMIVGQLVGRVDSRLLVLTGLALNAVALHRMAHFSLGIDEWMVVSSGFIQGLGSGLIFVPLSTMVFATLDPRFRNRGAAMYSLTRKIGSSVGIALLQVMTIRNADIVRSRLVEGARPDNPLFGLRLPDFSFNVPDSVAGLSAEITRQATMVSYIDGFWALCVLCVAAMPLILLMRPRRSAPPPELVVAE